MPVDLTVPLCVLLSITLGILHFVLARNKYLLRAAGIILALPILAYVLPLGVFHICALTGSPWAMQKLGSLYYLRTPQFETLGLYYYNKAIQSGSYDAKLELASILRFEAKRENINRHHSNPHVSEDAERASLRQSAKWLSAKALLQGAAGPGNNRAIAELNEMRLEEEPMSLGRGIYLVRQARLETSRTIAQGTPAFFEHPKMSPEWMEGMRLLKEIRHEENKWLSDFYLFELLEVSPEIAGYGAVAIGKEITSRGEKPLDATADERKALVESNTWKQGVAAIRIQADRGDRTAQELLERISLFVK